MTASSSHDDLADLLGNLADTENGIDEETLDAIDNPKGRSGKSDDSGDSDDTPTDAAADMAAIAAAAAAGGDDDADEDVAEVVAADEDDVPVAVAESDAAGDAFEAVEDVDDAVDEEAAYAEAVHEEELQEGADALAAAAHGETLAEESEDMEQFAAVTATPVAGAGVATANRRHGRHAIKGDAMKATMAPILLTVGIVVMLPAIWGTMILMGVETFMSDRSNASTMAKFMLMCWPIAIALIVTAIILFMQIKKAKAKAAARAERG